MMNINRDELFDSDAIIRNAENFLKAEPTHITDESSPLSPGNAHEFYSNGDYWWPDPKSPTGLPYVRRDGMSNPENFNAHRHILRKMRTSVATLAAAYKLTKNEKYSACAVRNLREFFLDRDTYMMPHLEYAQAIPGVCEGRGIGIIDTLHLVEIPFAIYALEKSPHMTADVLSGLKKWFSDYLSWMNESEKGKEERDTTNNHAICWHVQALSFAGFVGDKRLIKECADRYKTVLLPNQMRSDGGFTDELSRTKPYGYSIFVLDNAVSLVYLATLYGEEDLWEYSTPDGRSIKLGLDFLYPYIKDKSRWFLPPDVEHYDAWPTSASFMLLAARRFSHEGYLELFRTLPNDPTDDEVRRSLAIRMPILLP